MLGAWEGDSRRFPVLSWYQAMLEAEQTMSPVAPLKLEGMFYALFFYFGRVLCPLEVVLVLVRATGRSHVLPWASPQPCLRPLRVVGRLAVIYAHSAVIYLQLVFQCCSFIVLTLT